MGKIRCRKYNSIDIDGVYNTPGANTRTFWERDPLSELHHFGSTNRYVFTVDGANSRVGINVSNPASIVRDFQVGDFTGNREICIASSTTGIGSISFGDGSSGNDPWRGFVQYNHASDYMFFGTANAQRLQISSGGNVGIGAAPSARLHVELDDNSYAPTAYFVNTNTGGSSIASANFIAGGKSSSFIQFAAGFLQISAHDTTNGVIVVKAKDAGVLFLDHVSSTSRITIGSSNTASHPLRVTHQVSNVSIYVDYDIVAYSDQSVKENVRPIENVINRINQSRGVLYDRIDSGEKDNIGFIAQELETTFPELVVTNEDGTKAVKYQNAVAVLFEAIKEQQKQINELKKVIYKRALKNKQ